jgi:hypothetical protein
MVQPASSFKYLKCLQEFYVDFLILQKRKHYNADLLNGSILKLFIAIVPFFQTPNIAFPHNDFSHYQSPGTTLSSPAILKQINLVITRYQIRKPYTHKPHQHPFLKQLIK